MAVQVPPVGDHWLHEIKHDGFRLMVRRDRDRVRLFTRNGHDWAARYPAIVGAAAQVQARSFLIDGEAVVTDERGVAAFDLLRGRAYQTHAFLWAFDLLDLDGPSATCRSTGARTVSRPCSSARRSAWNSTTM